MKAAKFIERPCPTCGTGRAIVSGEWLRERRKAAGLSLREFAARVGVSAPYICDIEKNRRNCLPKMRAAYEALV